MSERGRAIREILDRADSYEHVAIWYTQAARESTYLFRKRKDGEPDLRNPAARLVHDLERILWPPDETGEEPR